MQHIVCIVIYLKIVAFIKVEVMYFRPLGLRVGIKRKVCGYTLVSQIAFIIRQKKRVEDLSRQQQSIISAFGREQYDQFKHEYWLRLTASIDVVRLLVNQGFAFRGHDESKSSLNRGNFLEILSWYAKHCDKIHDYVLEHAPQNDRMTSPMIQKDIVTACKIETIKAIIEELNGDYFA
ncbi:uncharacterized protein LOC132061202 [Lycium ferocissimum]|uniref:uncharacterized protein LOC132061202 n=1 Tax=Lycium ferocissimum TaxID=112874 RepID=UPI002814A9BF|nr:uncharacterized protein LOC132061202 [Lycium ferocissimum]